MSIFDDLFGTSKKSFQTQTGTTTGTSIVNGTNTTTGNTSAQGATSGTTTTGPWGQISPIITDSLLPSLLGNYSQYGTLSPDALAAVQQGASLLGGQAGVGSTLAGVGTGLLTTGVPQAQQVTGQYIDYTKLPTIGGSSVSTQAVDPSAAFSALGAANPLNALTKSLSGTVDNPYLAGIAQGNIDQAKQQYGDLTADAANTLNYSTLPALRTQAALSGQYGGSRQGAEEGVATGLIGQQLARNARDLAASTAATNSNLFGTAYGQAQDRAATAANNLASLGIGTANNNADRALSAQTTNAQTSLAASQANAAQLLDAMKTNISTDADLNKFNAGVTLQNNQQNLDRTLAGAGLLGSAQGSTISNTDALLSLLTAPGTYATGQIGSLTSQLGGLAGLGSTSTSSGTSTNNTLQNLINQINSTTNTTETSSGTKTGSESDNPSTAKDIGTILQIASLFSDRRLKEDVRRVGMTDSGLPIYTYRYRGQPTYHMGVMAQEAQGQFPQAVREHESGMLMVDYREIG